MSKSPPRGFFGLFGQKINPPEQAAPQSQPWWRAQPTAGDEPQAGPPPAVAPTLRVALPPEPLPAASNDDSIHELVVPTVIRRKASVGPVAPARAPEPPAPLPPAVPPAPVQRVAPVVVAQAPPPPAPEPPAEPAEPEARPATDTLTLSLSLTGWVLLGVVVLAGAGGVGYYVGLVRGRADALAAVSPAPPTVEQVKSGPANPEVLKVATATPRAADAGRRATTAPAVTLERNKTYMVIQNKVTTQAEADAIVRFLESNGEQPVGAISYQSGNVSYWRVLSLKPVDVRATQQIKEAARRIEALGQKYKKAGGRYEFLQPYAWLYVGAER